MHHFHVAHVGRKMDFNGRQETAILFYWTKYYCCWM